MLNRFAVNISQGVSYRETGSLLAGVLGRNVPASGEP